MHEVVAEVTARIAARSRDRRADYLARMEAAGHGGPGRAKLSCANWAHAFAAQPAGDKLKMMDPAAPNIAIVSAYNDMLSAHQPLEHYPDLIRQAAREAGATAQFAGGVPAMCDGVTQGRPGMELSLFSRDVIAMATAVALTHDAFDGAILLGVCDKIVPGLVIGGLAFGHLPIVFAPAGPMTSGLSNAEKAGVRARYAQGLATREELLTSEMAAYHGPGTCTFYGTANSNQMLMEMMGLHLPGAAFVNPGTPLRDALTMAAARRTVEIGPRKQAYTPMARVIDEKAVVNGVVGLLATGGSTNHTLHLVAMARAAGIEIDWHDFADLSAVTPMLARVYPNGKGDVNHFHAAGGMAFVVRELLGAGLAHEAVITVAGPGLSLYQREPFLDGDSLVWREGRTTSLDTDILRPVSDPFDHHGGICVLSGGLGRAVMKTSAVNADHRAIEAPALVFDDQDDLLAAFEAGRLTGDFVAVVRFQGPKANGMPELHNLSPTLGVLLDRGQKVALVTDGRMSGASGKVPAAIHVTPEAIEDGPLAYVRDGDVIRIDAEAGVLEINVDPSALRRRSPATKRPLEHGFGRELFGHMRRAVGPAEAGASVLFLSPTVAAKASGLVGDVGGTHARFAIAETDGKTTRILHAAVLLAADYPTGEAALEAYLKRLKGARPHRAVIAAAGPIDKGVVSFTNNDGWGFSEKRVAKACGFSRVTLINDFTAQALAIDRLGARDTRLIGPRVRGRAHATAAIMGPGTGFGAAALVDDGRTRAVLTGEGGHSAFAPEDEVEIEILRRLTARFGEVSVERVVSGPGLFNLYQALAEMADETPSLTAPDQVTHAGLAGEDLARDALSRFCAILGSVAGNLALAMGAQGGVYISGGIAPDIFDFLAASDFRRRFEAKDRMSDYLRAIPTRVVTQPHAALIGAAALLGEAT